MIDANDREATLAGAADGVEVIDGVEFETGGADEQVAGGKGGIEPIWHPNQQAAALERRLVARVGGDVLEHLGANPHGFPGRLRQLPRLR